MNITGMDLLARAPNTPAEAGRGTAYPVSGIAPFDRRVIAVGAAVFGVLLAVATRYGFHRDELYFLECAHQLQASYVDQPVLTPLLAWVSLKLFGVSLLGLRMWPALAAWATVIIAGMTARELGAAAGRNCWPLWRPPPCQLCWVLITCLGRRPSTCLHGPAWRW